MAPIRILMMTERFAPDIGGVARSASRTAERFQQLGFDCEVFGWTKALPPGQLETNVQQINDQHVTAHRLGLFANFDFSMQHTINVLEWLHQQRPFDVLWGHYLYPSGFIAVMLARLLNVPSIVSARGNDIDRLMFPPGDFARLEWTLRQADRVTSVSEDLAKKIRVLAPEVKPVVIRNTVDVEVFSASLDDAAAQQLRRDLGIYPNEKVIGFCGELRHKKGLPFLLSALQEVRSHQPACLLVIGEVRSRDQASVFEYLRDDEEARKRIIVTGHMESGREVARHLSLCDVFLLPSVWDGLPNALLEAMACERVVVASDAGGIPEVVEHLTDGFLLPKALLHRLGTAAQEVLEMTSEEYASIGKLARKKIVDQFQPERERATLETVVRGLISNTST